MADKVTIFTPDFKLLAKQKATLTNLISNGSLPKEQKDHLEGLRNFIDHVQDYAAAELGAHKVYVVTESRISLVDYNGHFVEFVDPD